MNPDNVERIDSIQQEVERDMREEQQQAAIDSCYTDFMTEARCRNVSRMPDALECLAGGNDRLYVLLCDLAFSTQSTSNLSMRACKLIEAAACKYAEMNAGD